MLKMSNKGNQIKEMFRGVAPRYDFLNRLLSLGNDIRWRRLRGGAGYAHRGLSEFWMRLPAPVTWHSMWQR